MISDFAFFTAESGVAGAASAFLVSSGFFTSSGFLTSSTFLVSSIFFGAEEEP